MESGQQVERIAETIWDTPVYSYPGEVEPGIIPKNMLKRSQGDILRPDSDFAAFLARVLPRRPACIIMRHGKYIRIFKLGRTGEVFTVTARSIKEEDRKRLVELGVLKG